MSLRRVHWDGRCLTLEGEPHAPVALALDGVFFARLQTDAAGRAALAMPFSPNGHADLALRLDDAAAVGLRRDLPGFVPPPAPQPLAPLACEELLAPAQRRDLEREVAVVVPVYNAPQAVQACLDSVLAHSRGAWRLIVIDDASPDPAIAPLLARYTQHAEVLRNEANRGFTATANRGIAAAGAADVVLLNADTEVAAGWLVGLRRAAYAQADTASATAVSDNAGAFSVPELEQENPLPAGWTFADAARALRQGAGSAYPRLPTGNGFCLYLKREALDALGLLDEAAFSQGYGEENDWCQRAEAAGWRHVIAGDVLVRHARSASFGHARRQALGEAGMAVLRQRWPHYEAAVGETLWSFERRVLDWRVRRLYAGAPPRPRHLACGEAPAPTGWEAWRLRRDDALLLMEQLDGKAWRVVERAIAPPVAAVAGGFAAERALVRWLQRHAFERADGDAAVFAPALPRWLHALGIEGSAARPA